MTCHSQPRASPPLSPNPRWCHVSRSVTLSVKGKSRELRTVGTRPAENSDSEDGKLLVPRPEGVGLPSVTVAGGVGRAIESWGRVFEDHEKERRRVRMES